MVVWLKTPRRETTVESAIEGQIAELGRLTVTQLRQKYSEVFGEENRALAQTGVPAARPALLPVLRVGDVPQLLLQRGAPIPIRRLPPGIPAQQ